MFQTTSIWGTRMIIQRCIIQASNSVPDDIDKNKSTPKESTRRVKSLINILTLGAFVPAMAGCQSQNNNLAEKEFIGMEKTAVVQMLGEPDKIEELTKSTEYIFGPIENLWDQIEMGEKIVIWTYEAREGYMELYFLNDSSTVADEFFWYNDPGKNPVF